MHLNQADIETTGDPVVPIADAVTPEEVARSISASFSEWRPADPQHLPLYFPRIPRLAPMVTVRDIKLAEHAEAVARTSGLGLSLADASPLDLNLLAFGDAPAYEGLLREMSEVVSLVSRQTKKDLRDLSFFGGPIDRLSPIRIAPIHGPLQFVVETMTRDAVKELALLETAERTDFCDLPQSSVPPLGRMHINSVPPFAAIAAGARAISIEQVRARRWPSAGPAGWTAPATVARVPDRKTLEARGS